MFWDSRVSKKALIQWLNLIYGNLGLCIMCNSIFYCWFSDGRIRSEVWLLLQGLINGDNVIDGLCEYSMSGSLSLD